MLIFSGAYIVEMLIVHLLMMGCGLLYRATLWSSGVAWNICKDALRMRRYRVDLSLLGSNKQETREIINMPNNIFTSQNVTKTTQDALVKESTAHICIDIN